MLDRFIQYELCIERLRPANAAEGRVNKPEKKSAEMRNEHKRPA